jgi:serine/threonine-protein kinase RsbW
MVPKDSLQIESRIEEVSRVYEWIEMHLQNKVENKIQNNVLLVTQEIVTNAIVHGNNEDVSKKVIVTFEMSQENITVTVEDEGEGCPPLPSKEEAQFLDYLSENGRGLKLAVLMCKRIETNQNLITLVFEK